LIIVKGIWNNPGSHFDIADGEDISLVVEHWLNARSENADIFVAGANLTWCVGSFAANEYSRVTHFQWILLELWQLL